MTTNVKPIPDGFHTVTPYFMVKGGSKAIDFYKRAFGAKERFRMAGPDPAKIGHAEILIGNSIVMLADEWTDCGNHSPQSLGGSPISLLIYVEDVDTAFKKAVDAGATVKEPVENKFYGDRSGRLTDPFGHTWTLMTHIEDVAPDEMKRRMQKVFGEMAATAGKGA